jgi:hypothetical protein
MKTAQNWGPWGPLPFHLGTAKNNGKSRLGTVGTVGTALFPQMKYKNSGRGGHHLARDKI